MMMIEKKEWTRKERKTRNARPRFCRQCELAAFVHTASYTINKDTEDKIEMNFHKKKLKLLVCSVCGVNWRQAKTKEMPESVHSFFCI